MSLEIKRPDDYNILFIGGEALREETGDLVAEGRATFIEAGSEEAKELLKGHPELEGLDDLAIVVGKDGEQGEVCAISQAGRSLIVHCENGVFPIKE